MTVSIMLGLQSGTHERGIKQKDKALVAWEAFGAQNPPVLFFFHQSVQNTLMS